MTPYAVWLAVDSDEPHFPTWNYARMDEFLAASGITRPPAGWHWHEHRSALMARPGQMDTYCQWLVDRYALKASGTGPILVTGSGK